MAGSGNARSQGPPRAALLQRHETAALTTWFISRWRLGDLRAGSDPRGVSVARHCARWHAGQRKVQARGARYSVQGSGGGGPATSKLICRVRAPGFREDHYPPERQSARACARS